MAHSNDAEIAGRVRDALEERGVPIRTLAADTGIAERTLRRRLAGESHWLTNDLHLIASRLGVPPSDLIGD